MILNNRISIVTGGPGTGKTTICEEIVLQLGDVLGVALSARATRNLADRSGARTMTIHKFLRTAASHSYSTIIVDEASMIGSEQMAGILRIAERQQIKRVVLIGDAEQLPPIDWGRPFADLIAGDVLPTAVLTKNYRTDANGGIAELGRDVRDCRTIGGAYENVTLISATGPEKIAQEITMEYLERINTGAKFEEMAILSPYRDPKFPISSESLNKDIRLALAKPADCATPGDIVIATRNNYDKNAINGVRGLVKEGGTNRIVIQFDNTSDVSVYDKDEIGSNGLPEGITWGYAYSVHKAQGSEFRHVIVVVSEDMARLFGKPALYTAVTRARETLTIVGDLAAIPKIIASPDRRTTVLGAIFSKSVSRASTVASLSSHDIAARIAALKEQIELAPEGVEDDLAIMLDRG